MHPVITRDYIILLVFGRGLRADTDGRAHVIRLLVEIAEVKWQYSGLMLGTCRHRWRGFLDVLEIKLDKFIPHVVGRLF